jgi:hypothetical protein
MADVYNREREFFEIEFENHFTLFDIRSILFRMNLFGSIYTVLALSTTMKRSADVYRNYLKNREFDKEASQNSHLERATIVCAQGASEEENVEKKPTPSKTNSLSSFGICSSCKHSLSSRSFKRR